MTRRLSRRTFLKGTTALAASAAVAQELAGPALAASSPAGTVRVLSVADPFYFALKEVLPDFTKKTGLKVDLQSLGYDAMQARLISSFVSKTSDADVITVDQMWGGQYVDNGWINTLDAFAAKDKDFDIKDFIPEVVYSISTWRGKLATAPVAAYAQGVMYRKSVFEALKIDEPRAGWTWDEYTEIAKRIQGQTVAGAKMFGTVVCGAQPVPVVHMFSQLSAGHNAAWFKQFPGKEPWDFTPDMESAAMLAAVNQYKTLFDLSPAESINYNWFDAGTRYSAGDVGLLYWWTPYFYLINNDGYMTGKPSKVRGDFGVAPCPIVPGKTPAVSLGGWGFGMPSTTNKPDAAWQFIKWATSASVQKLMGQVEKYGAQFADFSRKSLYADADMLKLYPFLPAQLDMMAHGDGKLARPPAPIYTTLEGVFGLELNKVLAGQEKAPDALKQVNALFTNALKGNFLIPYSGESYADTLEATKALINRLAG
jgi:multiple sugar transport system substrate-binding protein